MGTNKHKGSNFDDFLEEEGLLAEAESVAIKRVLAYQIETALHAQGISKSVMAHRMHTSRASIDRLLNPENSSVTLQTLTKAAAVIGKKISIELQDLRH